MAHNAQLGDAAVGDVVDLMNVLQQEPASSIANRLTHNSGRLSADSLDVLSMLRNRHEGWT